MYVVARSARLARQWIKKKREMNYLSVKCWVYRIFSIKRPRRLFQNWPCGPGVYLKPAFNQGPAFIYEVQYSVIFFSDLFIHPSSET